MDAKILIVEDDPDLRELVGENIRGMGLAHEFAVDGEQGLARALGETFGLVILDVMLPGLDGMTVCQRLRQAKPQQAIMMLTAKGDEVSRVLGLEFGADDYMVKPFSVPEFRARIKALLRRTQSVPAAAADAAAPQPLVFGDLVIDPARKKVTLKDAAANLTALEFDLLYFLASNPGRPFSRGQLLEQVWGFSSELYENNVNSHINRIRNKIESDPAQPKYVLTARGVGYRFAERHELAAGGEPPPA